MPVVKLRIFAFQSNLFYIESPFSHINNQSNATDDFKNQKKGALPWFEPYMYIFKRDNLKNYFVRMSL
jgi:hypothetical protein